MTARSSEPLRLALSKQVRGRMCACMYVCTCVCLLFMFPHLKIAFCLCVCVFVIRISPPVCSWLAGGYSDVLNTILAPMLPLVRHV